jgi:hypothetical protein
MANACIRYSKKGVMIVDTKKDEEDKESWVVLSDKYALLYGPDNFANCERYVASIA